MDRHCARDEPPGSNRFAGGCSGGARRARGQPGSSPSRGAATAWGCFACCTSWRRSWACGSRWRTSTTACGARRRGRMRRSCADLAGSLGLPFDLGRWQPSATGHFEADARAARYDWLLEIAARAGRDGRGGRPHARRPGRDDPPPDRPRHRAARTGGHAPRRVLAGTRRSRWSARCSSVSRQAIRDYLESAGTGLPRGCQQRRPVADPGPDPPRPPAPAGRGVQPPGRRGPRPAGDAGRRVRAVAWSDG